MSLDLPIVVVPPTLRCITIWTLMCIQWTQFIYFEGTTVSFTKDLQRFCFVLILRMLKMFNFATEQKLCWNSTCCYLCCLTKGVRNGYPCEGRTRRWLVASLSCFLLFQRFCLCCTPLHYLIIRHLTQCFLIGKSGRMKLIDTNRGFFCYFSRVFLPKNLRLLHTVIWYRVIVQIAPFLISVSLPFSLEFRLRSSLFCCENSKRFCTNSPNFV